MRKRSDKTHHGVRQQGNGREGQFQSAEPLPAGELIEAGRLGEFLWHRAQRLVERERHVPHLAGEDREDRRRFQPQQTPREEGDEAGHADREEPEHRHRLKNVQQRDQDLLGLAVVRGDGANQQAEQG
jgi:hypothetical protein